MNTFNKSIRYLLFPFVFLGWGLTRIGNLLMATTFGRWAGGMLSFGALFWGVFLIGFGISHVPGTLLKILLGAIAAIIAVLMIVGMMRGTLYAVHGVKFSDLSRLHVTDPISIRSIIIVIVTCLGTSVAIGAIIELSKLISGR